MQIEQEKYDSIIKLEDKEKLLKAKRRFNKKVFIAFLKK